MTYNLFEHRHRFSAWAAARAAQRGLLTGTIERCGDALRYAKLKEFVQEKAGQQITNTMFDKLHREWCEQVVCYFGKNGVSANINNRAAKMYGRAAKLVGVYLKCMVVIGPSAKTQLAHVAHPPIDSNLLKELAKVPGISPKAKKTFSDTRWTDLDFDGYDNLIETIRAEEKLQEDIDPFWRLERYWPKL